MQRIGLWFPFLIACALAVVLALAVLRSPRADHPLIGQSAPAPKLSALEGIEAPRDVASANPYAGVRIVNFWASWCAPCKIEHPQLMQLAREGVVIDGYIYRDEPQKARAMLRAGGNPYRVSYLDPDGKAMMAFGSKGVPESYVIDKNGIIVLHITGVIDPAILNDVLRPVLIKAATAP
jgi:cytochrome c biogenesis protein CcmG/thiol:disulfide interchange protein DsbE